jgi:hypothetical protein
MRNTLVTGLLLAAAALLTVLFGSWLDLETDQTALLGVASGAVVVLAAPAGQLGRSLGGFVLGIVLALIGFFVRAALLPDTSSGRAVYAMVVVLLCTVAALATRQFLALWSLLLGAASFAGAYEAAYNLAPPQVATTSISTLTTLVLCAAMGFLAASLAAPRPERQPVAPQPPAPQTEDHTMENAQ